MNYIEYTDLKAEIDYHMDAYYNLDEPVISDYEYDQLMQKLKDAEREHPEWVTPDSPSQKIGGVAKREAGVKVTHNVPMLSIEDVFDKKEVEAWVDKVKNLHPDCTFSVETKIDGLSATIRYLKSSANINGRQIDRLKMTVVETRGDGEVGEDVTANAKVISDVKQVLDLPYDNLEIRGEVYMTHENFETYNLIQEKLGKKLAVNPRNLAAGTFRQLDPSITKERGLSMFIFNVQSGPDELMESHSVSLDKLAAVGVPVVWHRHCNTKQEILQTIDEIAEMRSSLPYDIDGAVVKIDEIRYRNDFPAGSKYSSGHIAYKYPPEEKIVVIDKVLVDVGRTGKLTFTAEFHDRDTGKPAKLCGTSVSRATLHNIDYIKSMHIGIGGQYKLFKSGEIIPKLNGCVVEPDIIWEAPDKCPVCGSNLVDDGAADIRCLNPNCPVQLSRTISYFAGNDAMNIMGLGEIIVDDLVSHGYLKNYSDIYKLKDHRDALIEDGIIGKEKNTDKILAAIEKSKNAEPQKLLTGLGIRNVGKGTSKDIMKHFASILDLANATYEQLVAINDIGDTTAKCIVEFFSNPDNLEIIRSLENAGVNMTVPANENNSGKLSGMSVAVTGTLPTLGRKEIEELIEKNGGRASNNVSKNTSILVAGEAAGSKLTKAQELGIKIISEAEFLEMLS